MIRVVIVDDEPLALKQLELYIGKIPFLELVASCPSAAAARPHVGEADILYVDINMPDLSGMDFVRSLENPPLVVFTTAYSEYAVEGFRVNAVDYLLKPFSLDEFQQAVHKLEERLSLRRAAGKADDGILRLSTANHTVQFDTAHIRYIEGMGEYLKVHLDTEPAPTIVLYRMKNILEKLSPEQFLRIHKSYIVSLARIREAKRSAVTLDDGTLLPVGESYRDQAWSRIGKKTI